MSADNNKANLANGAQPALRLAGQVAHGFIDSKLTPPVIVAALPLGADPGRDLPVELRVVLLDPLHEAVEGDVVGPQVAALAGPLDGHGVGFPRLGDGHAQRGHQRPRHLARTPRGGAED